MAFPTDHPILQSTVLPFRRQSERLEICLITSSHGPRWGFPKGVIDPGETAEETGLKEAYEEAGIRGNH